MAGTKVYLAPGFFGFTSLGAMSYFHRVAHTLERALADRGLGAQVVECPTQPSGSIVRRARRLLEHVVLTGGAEVDAIHFVGHSSGGVDVRLLLTPGVNVAGNGHENRVAERTRSAIMMSAPHHGTPLATFFGSMQGRRFLEFAARRASSMDGRAAIVGAARVLSTMAWAEELVGRRNTILHELSEALFRNLSWKRDDPVWEFLRAVESDQGIIVQLTPESLNLFNAVAADRPGVAYSCIATAVHRPLRQYGLQDLTGIRPALAAIYLAFHTITARVHRQYPYPEPDAAQRAVLEARLPFAVDSKTNDGVVPTLSQVRGRLLHAIFADHLDVVGQFRRPGEPLSDWMPSGAHFTSEEFEALWGIVADEIARAHRAA